MKTKFRMITAIAAMVAAVMLVSRLDAAGILTDGDLERLLGGWPTCCLGGQTCGQTNDDCWTGGSGAEKPLCRNDSDCGGRYFAEEGNLNACKPGGLIASCSRTWWYRQDCGNKYDCVCNPIYPIRECIPAAWLQHPWQYYECFDPLISC